MRELRRALVLAAFAFFAFGACELNPQPEVPGADTGGSAGQIQAGADATSGGGSGAVNAGGASGEFSSGGRGGLLDASDEPSPAADASDAASDADSGDALDASDDTQLDGGGD